MLTRVSAFRSSWLPAALTFGHPPEPLHVCDIPLLRLLLDLIPLLYPRMHLLHLAIERGPDFLGRCALSALEVCKRKRAWPLFQQLQQARL
jgi:hypothetical protein